MNNNSTADNDHNNKEEKQPLLNSTITITTTTTTNNNTNNNSDVDNDNNKLSSPIVLNKKIRFVALSLSCFLAFGGYLVFDLVSALKTELQSEMSIDDEEYSLLYLVYAWTNCLMVLFAGALVDKTSNRMCAVIFTTLAMIGQTILSIGVQLDTFVVMIIGRVIFGTGLGSICVAQNSIVAVYFRDFMLSTAFAATLTVSRIGSVTNFFLSTYIYTWFGDHLNAVFWFGTITCAFSVLCAVMFFILDKRVETKGLLLSSSSSSSQQVKRGSRKIVWRDVIRFPVLFWVLALICSLYYSNIFALMAVIVDYLHERNGFEKHEASMISSTIYLTAIPCVPAFGALIDRLGKRVFFIALSSLVLLGFDCYMTWTSWTPIPALVFAGASYSMVASSLWPSICLVVPKRCVGTANGIATSVQMVGIGCSNLVVGALRKHFPTYSEAMYYLTACSATALLLSVLAFFIDLCFHNGMLNKSDKQLKKLQPMITDDASASTKTTTKPPSTGNEPSETITTSINSDDDPFKQK